MTFSPVDEDARQRTRRDHASSLVLEAGAGTGKTTLLVDRIEELITSGRALLEKIAAVTFTENAATTMKLRLRDRLERARARLSGPERGRVEVALESLERAQISTIHALCAAILAERPLECGVVPGFRVADEAEADILFGEAWDLWLESRLEQGDTVLLEALERGIPLEGEGVYADRTSLKRLARTLIEERDLQPLLDESPFEPEAWQRELEGKAQRARIVAEGVSAGDTLAPRLEALSVFAERGRFLKGKALADHLLRMPTIERNRGHKPRWRSEADLEEARGIAAWTKAAVLLWRALSGQALHRDLVRSLSGVGEIYERRKAERGILDFLDLLVKARDALKGNASLCHSFQERFSHLLIDEFQDTDPVQVEIAELISGGRAGSLVAVGDAKQSIYRFRRAEVACFRALSARAASQPGMALLHLNQNFRSRPSILRFVNRVFAELIQASDEADQPAYEPIEPMAGMGDEPSVVALRFSAAPYASGEDLLRAESEALAAFLARAAGGQEVVRDLKTGEPRPSEAGDVMILVRRFTQLRNLEPALEHFGLRFTVEGGKSFFDRLEVREVLAVLKAIEDPGDKMHLVAALRSSFFGVSDRDIGRYALAGGQLYPASFDAEKPGGAALRPGIELLLRLHGRRTHKTVAFLLEELFDATRILPALSLTKRGEAAISNLEKVVALARSASELGILTLRGFARLLENRITTARDEPDLPSTRPGDPETLRILSIHKAKGLEAPIVALFDTADSLWIRPESIPLWAEGKIALGFREGCQPPRWDALRVADEARARAEGRRLLYVACTRPRDLLVIPEPPRDAQPGTFWKDLWVRLPTAPSEDVRVVDADTLPKKWVEETRIDLKELASASSPDGPAELWHSSRKEVLADASRRAYLPVSVGKAASRTAPPSVASVVEKGSREFGSLVHKILETIPFTEPGAALPMALAWAPPFGLDEAAARRAAADVERTLALPLLDRARRAQSLFRELPLWFPEGEELLEGVIDLVFEEEGSLVLADYKSDHLEDSQVLSQAAHHAPQLQLYGRGLAQALSKSVKERFVVFTSLGIAVPV